MSKAKAAAKPGGDELTAKDYYFDSYAHFGIHEEMLKDKVRTLTYRAAIEGNPHLFKDKIVLDVGCGTGILSMFAARAGAKHVYGIDCSTIAHQAKQIVADNNLADTVTIIQGKMEDLELPVEKVDIIISEWMGYALLYESMLPSVLHARDKWMADDGHMIPSEATIVMCAIEDQDYKAEKIDWWENVYGFDMSCIKKLATYEPLVDTVDHNQIVTDFNTILSIDCNTCSVADLTYDVPFVVTANRDDYIHALVMHFDCTFGASHKPVSFSTGPHTDYTHWRQTVFYLNETLTVKEGEQLKGSIKCSPNAKNHRDMDFEINYEFNGSIQQCSASLKYQMR